MCFGTPQQDAPFHATQEPTSTAIKYFSGTALAALRLVLTDVELATITDDTAYGDTPVEAMLALYVEGAESYADSYAAARYPGLSLATANARYREAILTIAKKRLLARRGYTSEALTEEYNDSVKWLQDIYIDRADITPNPNGEVADGADPDEEIISGLAPFAETFRDGFAV